ALLDMPASLIEKVYVKTDTDEAKELILDYLPKLARVNSVVFVERREDNTVADIGEFCEVFLSKEGIELKPIVDRLRNQEKKLQKETQKLESMLGNDKFVKNAPKEVIEQQKAQLLSSKNKLDKTILQLKQLDG
ncbi:MAG: valine--tRNA ligase, partial [Campylobacterales bacterium]